MKNTVRLFVFFLAFTTTIFTQELSTLYSSYLPDTIIKDREALNNIEKNITLNAQVSPRLNFYYLNYLKKTFLENDKKEASRFNQLLSKCRTYYRNIKYDWLIAQQKYIYEKETTWLELKAMLKVFDEGELTPEPNAVEATEVFSSSNEIEFIAYKYYYQRTDNYDSTKNYFQLNKKFLQEKLSEIENSLKTIGEKPTKEKERVLHKAAEQWQLFAPKNDYGLQSSFNLAEVAYTAYLDKYAVVNGPYVGISMLPTMEFLNWKVNYTFIDHPLPTRDFAISNTKTVDVSYEANFSVCAGYSVKLRQKRSYLSYLRVLANYGFSKSSVNEEKAPNEFFRTTYEYVQGTGYKEQIFRYEGSRDVSMQLFSVELSTPVFYLWDFQHFAVGINQIIANQKQRYAFSSTRVFNQGTVQTEEGRELVVFNSSRTVLRTLPFLSCNFSLFDYAEAGFRIYLVKSAALNFSVGAQF